MARVRRSRSKLGSSRSHAHVGGPFTHGHLQDAAHPFGRAKIAKSFGSKGRGTHRHVRNSRSYA